MASAGYSSTLKVTGAAVAVLAEATSDLGSNRFQITNSAKRIFDLSAAVVVYDGGVPVDEADYQLNPVFGIVTFDAPPGGAVTVDFSYLPLLSVAEVRQASFSCVRTMLDDTTFDSSGARHRKAGLKDCSGTWEQLALLSDDIDPGGGTRILLTALENGTLLCYELVAGGGTFRALFVIASEGQAVAVDDLVKGNVSWQASRPEITTAGLRVDRLFGFSSWT